MSSGIFFNIRNGRNKTSNGTFIKHDEEIFLVSCAHSFYEEDFESINFLIDPTVKGTNVNFSFRLKDLQKPIYHPVDDESTTHEIAIFKLNQKQREKVNSNNPPIFPLENPFVRPSKKVKLAFRGFNAGKLNQKGFQGDIHLLEEKFEYVSEEFLINASFTNTPRKTVNNHILSSKVGISLGAGYSGSAIISSKKELKGVYHASMTTSKNRFTSETKYGGLVFAGADKVLNAIEQKV